MKLSSSSTTCLLLVLTVLLPSCCLAEEQGECSAEVAEDGTPGTCSSSDDDDNNNNPNRLANHRPSQRNTLECGVYMAPSTLGEATNMGIYTGKDMQVDDVVNYPEIAIPLLFREWADHPEGFIDGSLWERYIWEGYVMDIESYVDTDREMSRAVFVPGVGCTINAVMDMSNIESTHGSRYDNAGLHRKKDPGIGAFTPYHGAETTITHPVKAGAELFASYGAEWIPDIPGAQVTLNPELDDARDFLKDSYLPFVKQHASRLSDRLKQGLWDFTTTDFPISSRPFTNLPKSQPWSVVEQAIVDHEQNQQQQQEDEENEEEEDVVRQFIRNQSIRSLDWLNENGYCQDHIVPGRSTIAQAGHGGFAARDLPKGTIVGYSPLIHIGTEGRELLAQAYEDDLDDDYYENDGDADEFNEEPEKIRLGKDRYMYDLILNYSFGHKNSTVLLTPYGGMVNYINHDSKNPNIRIKWPDNELVAHKPEWLEKDVFFLRDTVDKIGLSFEYVAIRDIKQGEELFMNYGKEWEDAWNEHVADWEPLEDAHEYVHSSDWDEEYFRTHEELTELDKPYPPNLHTMCIESFTTDDDGNFWYIPILRDTTERVYCDVVNRRKVQVTDNDNDEPEYEYIYDVDLKLMTDDEESWVHVRDYKPDGIFLYDHAFATDWHMPNVFRHEIMIDDLIMPKSWQNGPPEHPF